MKSECECGCAFESGFAVPCERHRDVEGEAVRAALAAWFRRCGARWPASAGSGASSGDWIEELEGDYQATRAALEAMSPEERAALMREINAEIAAAEGDPRLYVAP